MLLPQGAKDCVSCSVPQALSLDSKTARKESSRSKPALTNDALGRGCGGILLKIKQSELDGEAEVLTFFCFFFF